MVNINAKYNARWKSRSVEAAETGDGPRPEVAVGTGGGTRLVMEISGCSGRLSRRRRWGLADVRSLTPRHVHRDADCSGRKFPLHNFSLYNFSSSGHPHPSASSSPRHYFPLPPLLCDITSSPLSVSRIPPCPSSSELPN